jgi:hypothetical protein
MNAFQLVLDGAIVACGRILRQRNGYTEFDYALLERLTRSVAKSSIDAILTEWSELVDSNATDSFVKEFVNAQAIEMGIKFADAYHNEMVWQS